MPTSAIPGYVKKRTASQKYNRSPRQLTRDITVALAMKDESVLEKLRIRTVDGETIVGMDLTSEQIKQLTSDGRNPMWYLNSAWLEETYGRRMDKKTEPNQPSAPSKPEPAPKSESAQKSSSPEHDLVSLMKESLRELKSHNETLTEQLKIKDQQIIATTERWKESNYISQGLNERLEAMEKRLDAGSIANSTVVETSVAESEVSASSSVNSSSRQSEPKKKGQPAEHSKALGKNFKYQWYEMPTVSKLLSRFK